MNQRRIGAIVFLTAILLTAFSCTHPISRQLRQEARLENISLAMVLENPAAYTGKTVLWGGQIIETTNFKDGAEIVVLEIPVNFLGEPGSAQSSRGRFVARSPGFLDPAIYKPYQDITLAGEVIGLEERSLDKTTYRYPVVMIKQLYLWQPAAYLSPYPDYYRYDPFWRPYHLRPMPFFPY